MNKPLAHDLTDERPAIRRHIALVLAGLGAGGAERVASLVSARWVRQGHQVTVIAFDHVDAAVFHAFDPAIAIRRLGIDARPGPLSGLHATVRRYRALRRTLDDLRPDVTVSFLTKINVLALLASLGTSRGLVISERNNPRLQQASGLWNRMLRMLSWRADAIVMQTAQSLECLDPRDRQRAQVIPNPVAVPAVSREPGKPPILAAVGRLTWQKGFDLLIAAFSLVAERHPDWRLVIWGEGQDRGELEDLVIAAGLNDRVLLPGNSGSPDEWAGQADAFVLSSRYEGFSNVLAEAMAAGLPVIAFDCDYSPAEMIDHGRNGVLVRNGDVAALARAIDRVLGDPQLRAALGEAARESSSRLEPNRIADRWLSVIDKVAARRETRQVV